MSMPARQQPAREVLTGIDVLKRDGFRQLAGRKVGLITNHTGRSREGESTVKLLHEAKNVRARRPVQPGAWLRRQARRLKDRRHAGRRRPA